MILTDFARKDSLSFFFDKSGQTKQGKNYGYNSTEQIFSDGVSRKIDLSDLWFCFYTGEMPQYPEKHIGETLSPVSKDWDYLEEREITDENIIDLVKEPYNDDNMSISLISPVFVTKLAIPKDRLLNREWISSIMVRSTEEEIEAEIKEIMSNPVINYNGTDWYLCDLSSKISDLDSVRRYIYLESLIKIPEQFASKRVYKLGLITNLSRYLDTYPYSVRMLVDGGKAVTLSTEKQHGLDLIKEISYSLCYENMFGAYVEEKRTNYLTPTEIVRNRFSGENPASSNLKFDLMLYDLLYVSSNIEEINGNNEIVYKTQDGRDILEPNRELILDSDKFLTIRTIFKI